MRPDAFLKLLGDIRVSDMRQGRLKKICDRANWHVVWTKIVRARATLQFLKSDMQHRDAHQELQADYVACLFLRNHHDPCQF